MDMDRPLATGEDRTLSAFGQKISDPLLECLRMCTYDDRVRYMDFLKGKYRTIENVERLPGRSQSMKPHYPHLYLRTYAKYSNISDAEAVRIGSLLMFLLQHSSKDVQSSGGWADMEDIAQQIDDAGFSRAWARLMHAAALLPQNDIQILSVRPKEDDDQSPGRTRLKTSSMLLLP